MSELTAIRILCRPGKETSERRVTVTTAAPPPPALTLQQQRRLVDIVAPIAKAVIPERNFSHEFHRRLRRPNTRASIHPQAEPPKREAGCDGRCEEFRPSIIHCPHGRSA